MHNNPCNGCQKTMHKAQLWWVGAEEITCSNNLKTHKHTHALMTKTSHTTNQLLCHSWLWCLRQWLGKQPQSRAYNTTCSHQHVTLPNGSLLKSSHKCVLDTPQPPPTAQTGYIIPGMRNHSLMTVTKIQGVSSHAMDKSYSVALETKPMDCVISQSRGAEQTPQANLQQTMPTMSITPIASMPLLTNSQTHFAKQLTTITSLHNISTCLIMTPGINGNHKKDVHTKTKRT